MIQAPKQRRWSAAAAFLALLLVLPACGERPSPVPDAPTRIVSLMPTATETLFALGAGELVVGRSAWCDYPEEVLALPAVADALSAGAERILALRPDLILVGSDAQARALGALSERVRVEKFVADDVAGVRESIARLGGLVGRAAAAEELLSRIDAAFARARDREPRDAPPRVLFVVQHEPLRVAGGPSHITELLEAVGAVNVAGELDRPWPELSLESLVAGDVDVIIDASLAPEAEDADALDWWARFASLTAVRRGRVVRLTEPAVVRPGPRLPLALAYLDRVIHGETR